MKQRRNQDKRVMTFTLLWTAPKAVLAKGILGYSLFTFQENRRNNIGPP